MKSIEPHLKAVHIDHRAVERFNEASDWATEEFSPDDC
jgi:hypothetical protein